MQRHLLQYSAVFVVSLAIGVAVGWYLHTSPSSVLGAIRQSDLNKDTSYKYIDPLLALRGASTVNTAPYQSLQRDVQNAIDAGVKAGTLSAASIYFNDIGQTGGFVLNPDEKYSPASLLKVPTMMSYFKLAETSPAALTAELVYGGVEDANTQEHLRSPVTLTAGGVYSIEELISHMIKNSDNNAAEMLLNNLNNTNHTDAFTGLFSDLGITGVDATNDFITIRAYSLFFRVLYNSTYLNREHSEEALNLLTQTDFNDGLRAGVPQGTDIAHKFGEFTLQTQTGAVLKNELHDCGIVYYPKHPYILCIMTKGMDFNALKPLIADISRLTYNFMSTKYPATL